MNQESEFPFSRARLVTAAENQKFRQALSEQFDLKLRQRGRPEKEQEEKY